MMNTTSGTLVRAISNTFTLVVTYPENFQACNVISVPDNQN